MRFQRIVLAVSISAIMLVIAAAAGSASAATSGACPSSPKNFVAADNVGATFSNAGDITTYFFSSLTDENPVGGVPGLIKYCVYPGGPKSGTAVATGGDGEAWLFRNGSKNFSFVRPGGNKSNIPLDGTTGIEMGTVDWGKAAPGNQTILLHINDPTECTLLYGDSLLNVSGTCFVKPSAGPICNAGAGATGAAYNALPFGVVDCQSPSLGFEAEGVNEFGDEVTLAGNATAPGRKLVSLNVSFNSWGCGTSGHWFDAACSTTRGATFTVPITANIYAGVGGATTGGVSPGSLLATVTQTQTIPFRPSADPTNCPGHSAAGGADGGRWLNTASGVCQDYIVKVLTFTFPAGTTLPNNVIWTVAFNTSHSGYNPLLCANPGCAGATLNPSPPACNSSPAGCGYDSLNVGDKSYPNAPYAGVDIDEDVAFISFWSPMVQYPPPFGFGTLQMLISQLGWTGFRPLGEIITTP